MVRNFNPDQCLCLLYISTSVKGELHLPFPFFLLAQDTSVDNIIIICIYRLSFNVRGLVTISRVVVVMVNGCLVGWEEEEGEGKFDYIIFTSNIIW